MAENLERAKAIYEMLCQTMDGHNWKYSGDPERLLIESGTKTEDLPIKFWVQVDAERQLVSLVSSLPFRVKAEKRLEAAVAVCAINDRLADGCFRYNVTTGDLMFVSTNSFRENSLSKEAFTFMIFIACKIIDEYNEKIFTLVTGGVSLQDFLTKL
ncbi:MAG: YbjN domain-containing protein [Oscillospiraceae bacterium]|nr:YbjN domain-containing protein [Oscillospiraceae bacterium]